MIRFIIWLSAVTAVIVGAVQVAVSQQWIERPSFFIQTLILVVFTTGVIFTYLYKVSKPAIFVQLYLLTMIVKIVAYGAYVYFVVEGDANGAFANAVFFLIAYLIFTGLEIVFLYKKISTSHTA